MNKFYLMSVLLLVVNLPVFSQIPGTPNFFFNASLPPNTVISATGRIWMDRNLGATQVATSSTDAASYGDLYQWGRGSDGHQIRTSATTAALSSTNTPGNALFISTSAGPNDWRSSKNDNLWQGVNGVNNPCPTGYRIPTQIEFNAEGSSWASSNPGSKASASPLRLSLTGGRRLDGSLYDVDYFGHHWTSTISNTTAQYFSINSTSYIGVAARDRATGYSVRCIKD